MTRLQQAREFLQAHRWIERKGCTCGVVLYAGHEEHLADELTELLGDVTGEAKLERLADLADKHFRLDLDVDSDMATMSRAQCTCPDDCDCDGRFACEEQAGDTTYRCELRVGHAGWHRSANHRWSA